MKNNLKFISSLIVFFMLPIAIITFVALVIPNFLIYTNHLKNYVIIDTIASFIVAVLLGIINYEIIKEDFHQFWNKGNLKPYLIKIVKYTVLMFMLKTLVGMFENVLFSLCGVELTESSNQGNVMELLNASPILLTITGIFFAPLSEELLFRGAVRKTMNKKGIYITVSGLIFGLMHVVDSVSLLLEIFLIGLVLEKVLSNKDRKYLFTTALVLLIVGFGLINIYFYGDVLAGLLKVPLYDLLSSPSYVIAGIYFAYIYVHENNIFANIGTHALQNTISFLLILFL